jgi:hypothetical protein
VASLPFQKMAKTSKSDVRPYKRQICRLYPIFQRKLRGSALLMLVAAIAAWPAATLS